MNMMRNKEVKHYQDDDGRVIANMNVEGMPWYDGSIRREKRAERVSRVKRVFKGDGMTQSQARRFTFHAVLAGLTIALVYAVVMILFTLFATQIWFR
jgi:hypothetical protein